jgi:hypothetical protein
LPGFSLLVDWLTVRKVDLDEGDEFFVRVVFVNSAWPRLFGRRMIPAIVRSWHRVQGRGSSSLESSSRNP